MRSRIIIYILSSFYTLASFAQQNLITCSSERNTDNSVSILAESRAYGTYTVKVMFSTLAGYSTTSIINRNTALATIEGGRKEILKLTQDKSASMYSFQYTYQYFPGRALRRAPDSTFVYLLPSNAGNHLRVLQVYSLEDRIGQKRSDDFYATGFIYKLGDTICASRAGIIYECSDAVKVGEKETESFRSTRNKISIQHKDGSLGNYSVLAPIKLLVSQGDYVIPGQPLAIFDKESEKYQVLFSIYYLDERKLLADNPDRVKPSSSFNYLPMYFYVPENDGSNSLQLNKQYAVQHSRDVIAAEMSKKDKKKWGFQ